MGNSPALPEHHRQWFQQMQAACKNDQLALMLCLDAVTGESRSVICIVQPMDAQGEITFTPVGHLAITDNPYDAYIPPDMGED